MNWGKILRVNLNHKCYLGEPMKYFVGLGLLLLMLYPASNATAQPPQPAEIESLQKAAEAGSVEAQYNLGLIYSKRLDRDSPTYKTSYENASKWLQLAADSGHAGAQYELSMMVWGHTHDNFQALQMLKKAAERGHEEAQLEIAGMYLRGIWDYKTQTGIRDHVEARKWYSKSAEARSRRGIIGLASMYARGLGGPLDRNRALSLLLPFDKTGNANPEVLVQIGTLYYQGVEGIPNDFEAIKYFQRAAEKRNADAMWILVLMYQREEGGADNSRGADLRWEMNALKSGHRAPWPNRFEFLIDATNGEIPLGLAFQEFQDAFGRKYFNPSRYVDSLKEVLTVLRKMASEGDHISRYSLGLIYKYGFGVQKDLIRAENYFLSYVEARVPYDQYRQAWQLLTYVQYELGDLYFNGNGALQGDDLSSDVLAYMWYKLSFFEYTNGGIFFTHRPARKAMDILKSRMDKEELVLAEKLANAWIKKKYSYYFYNQD